MRNESGKVLTIFLVLIAIILISLTAISVFLFMKQVQLRETAEVSLSQVQASEKALRVELEEIKKQKGILDEKVKEAEAKIESLLEEVDLVEGIRDEVKKENRELKENLETLTKSSEEATQQVEEAQVQVADLQGQLGEAQRRNEELEAKRLELEKEYNALKARLSMGAATGGESIIIGEEESDVDLQKIVVSNTEGQGQVVSVDHEAAFVIVSLGKRNGIEVNATLSLYDGNKYLGDILVTKVLPELAAADFVDPLTSQQVSEGNLVKVK